MPLFRFGFGFSRLRLHGDAVAVPGAAVTNQGAPVTFGGQAVTH